MEDKLLNPLNGYNSLYKDEHKKNTIDYFDNLIKECGVNIEENKETCKKYYATLKQIDQLASKIKSFNLLKILIIVLGVILTLIAIIYAYNSFSSNGNTYVGIILIVFTIFAWILIIYLINRKINVKIKNIRDLKKSMEEKAQNLLQTAWQQMSVLNAKYDWGIPSMLFTKTIPLIEMDKYLDEKKFQYLHDKFGLNDNNEDNVSTYFVQSGSILGNPFLLYKNHIQEWYNHRYVGSRTVHWTRTIKTEHGSETIHESETLYASVYEPAPKYKFNTYLIYGNEAAPNLSFTRKPTVNLNMNKNDIQRFVKNKVKKLDKKASKAVTTNQNYTRFSNDEFEALFGGTDRNNEIEYRLLFTPLSQKSMLDLLKSKEPFGDDFYFTKSFKLNFIKSHHSQNADYYGNPNNFVHFDYDKARNNFISYNIEYFKNLYFDLAPLMAIPLYQDHKTSEYIYKKEFNANISHFEHEATANTFNTELLKPDKAVTPLILKTQFINKEDTMDQVKITSKAFRTVTHITNVSTLCRNGHFYEVPVQWLEYVPVEKDTYMAIEGVNSSREQFNNMRDHFVSKVKNITRNDTCKYERGLLAMLIYKALSSEDSKFINSSFINQSNEQQATIISQLERVRIIKEEYDKCQQNLQQNNSLDEKEILEKTKDEATIVPENEVNTKNIELKQDNHDEDDSDDE